MSEEFEGGYLGSFRKYRLLLLPVLLLASAKFSYDYEQWHKKQIVSDLGSYVETADGKITVKSQFALKSRGIPWSEIHKGSGGDLTQMI